MDQTIQSLFQFIKNSPSCFHAAMSMAKQLEAAGYHELKEYDSWRLQPGGRYYMERNQSSIVAFQLPMQEATHFQITASHSDSPSFKLKPKAEMDVYGTYIKLNVEGYGGMLCSTWFDRPLAIAGRAVIKTKQGIVSRLVHIDEDLVLIPNVAIHMNRNANSNISYNIQNDLLPLYAMKQEDDVMDVIAAAAGCDKTAVINTELFLYNRQQGSVWGLTKNLSVRRSWMIWNVPLPLCRDFCRLRQNIQQSIYSAASIMKRWEAVQSRERTLPCFMMC